MKIKECYRCIYGYFDDEGFKFNGCPMGKICFNDEECPSFEDEDDYDDTE